MNELFAQWELELNKPISASDRRAITEHCMNVATMSGKNTIDVLRDLVSLSRYCTANKLV